MARTGRSESQWAGHRFPDLIHKRVIFSTERPTPSGGGGGANTARAAIFGLGDGSWNGEGQPIEIGVLPRPMRVAFIDDRLMWSAGGSVKTAWEELRAALLGSVPSIQPVLLTNSRDVWSTFGPDEALLLEDAPEGDVRLDHERMVQTATDWLTEADYENPPDWRLFFRLDTERSSAPPFVSIAGLDPQLEQRIQAAFLAAVGPVSE